jgi:bisphosphoglycerate-dependent phosphoglycerate mutase
VSAIPSEEEKHINKRSCQGLSGQRKQEDISKVAKEKCARGMAQVTEHLPSKCKNPEFKPQYCQPLPQPKNKNYCSKTHRVITVSNMHCKAIHILPEKVKGFKAFRSIKCFLKSWGM